MRVDIKSKNFTASEHLKEIFEKKFAKLDKYFPEEIAAQVNSMKEKDHFKTEATIHAKQHIFRAEVITDEPYEAVDKLVDKLSNQMSRFKTKLQKKYKEHQEFKFAELPDIEDEQEEINVVRKKTFQLKPMTADDAVVQMEQLSHDFYVYMDVDSGKVSVAYKRKSGDYGILETE